MHPCSWKSVVENPLLMSEVLSEVWSHQVWLEWESCVFVFWSPFFSPNSIQQTTHHRWFFGSPPLELLITSSQHPQVPKAQWKKSSWSGSTDFQTVVVLVWLNVFQLLLWGNLGNSIFRRGLMPPLSKCLVLALCWPLHHHFFSGCTHHIWVDYSYNL